MKLHVMLCLNVYIYMNVFISINWSTKLCVLVLIILQMACVGPQAHGGDAGGDPPPPHRPYFTTPGYCFGKKL